MSVTSVTSAVKSCCSEDTEVSEDYSFLSISNLEKEVTYKTLCSYRGEIIWLTNSITVHVREIIFCLTNTIIVR